MMKTIQEVIKELDPKEIESSYFATHPVNITEIKNYENISIKEYKTRISEHFQTFLTKLCNTKAEHNSDNECILIVHKTYSDDLYYHRTVSCVSKNEVKTLPADQVSSYAYEFTETKEALSFFVADNILTQQHLMEVVVSFLDEISFFGYDQEHLEEHKRQLEESIEEMNNMNPENCKSYTIDELTELFGLPEEPKYPKEDVKERLIQKLMMNYNEYCWLMELDQLKEAL